MFVRNSDAMSVDILLVWWQEKNYKYAWSANTSYNKIPCENGCEAGEKSNSLQRWFCPWETGQVYIQGSCCQSPSPGADLKSEPDGFSVNLSWHTQRRGLREAFRSAPLLLRGARPLEGGLRGQDSTRWLKTGGSSFRPVPE